jgi:hypothetical protein
MPFGVPCPNQAKPKPCWEPVGLSRLCQAMKLLFFDAWALAEIRRLHHLVLAFWLQARRVYTRIMGLGLAQSHFWWQIPLFYPPQWDSGSAAVSGIGVHHVCVIVPSLLCRPGVMFGTASGYVQVTHYRDNVASGEAASRSFALSSWFRRSRIACSSRSNRSQSSNSSSDTNPQTHIPLHRSCARRARTCSPEKV